MRIFQSKWRIANISPLYYISTHKYNNIQGFIAYAGDV